MLKLIRPRRSSMLLFYSPCHVTRVNHFARTVCPSLFSSAAEMHDLLSRRTFYALLGMHNISDYHWHQASLPIRFGGFGLRPVVDISSSAFVVSWAFFLSAFPDRFPLLHPKIGDLLKDEASSDSLLRFHLHTAVDQLKSITKEGQEPYTLRSLQEHPRKLQHHLSARIGEIHAEKCLHESYNDEDAARLRSLTGTGAGAWLEAIPSSSRLALWETSQ